MSKEIDNGGPAFARPAFSSGMTWNPSLDGMTLRDYFAAKALPALIDAFYEAAINAGRLDEFCPNDVAGQAYNYADAMLQAREVLP